MIIPINGNEPDERLLITVKEAAVWLAIPKYTLYWWALSHRIPHFKIGKRVMFSKDDLRSWVEKHRKGEAV